MSRPPTPTPPLPTITTTSASDHHPYTSPPRSSTLPQKQTAQKHHTHNHPHRSHRHHRHDKSVPQSAIERTAPNPFGELLRGEWPRRRGSNGSDPQPALDSPRHAADDVGDYKVARETALQRNKARKEYEEIEQRKRKWAEVDRLQKRRQEGEAELTQTLTHLSDLSTKMTRRLDYTYYSLLTSLSHLTTSVNAFFALAQSTRQMCEGFITSREELERDANASVKATSEALDRQAERVGQLQGRIKRGRGRVENLEGRLKKVRERVDEAEQRDGEGRKRAGRRMKILSSCAGCWIGILVVGLVLRHWGTRRDSVPAVTKGFVGGVVEEPVNGNVSLSDMMASVVESSSLEVTKPSRAETKEKSSSAVDAEATLRLLDEL